MRAYLCFIETEVKPFFHGAIVDEHLTNETEIECELIEKDFETEPETILTFPAITVESEFVPTYNYAFVWPENSVYPQLDTGMDRGKWYRIAYAIQETMGEWILFLTPLTGENGDIPYLLMEETENDDTAYV